MPHKGRSMLKGYSARHSILVMSFRIDWKQTCSTSSVGLLHPVWQGVRVSPCQRFS